MELRRAGWLGRVGLVRGVACAAAVLAVCVLPEAARGGGVSNQREEPRLSPSQRNLIELGRRLFFEPALSHLGKNACASCHEPEHGFGDKRQFSPEDVGRTRRHSQSLIDVDLKTDQHWDGEFLTVAALVEHRATSPGTPEGYGQGDASTPGRRSLRVSTPEVLVTFDEEADETHASEPSPEQDLGLAGARQRSRRGVSGFGPSALGGGVFVDDLERLAGEPEGAERADGAQRVEAHARYVEARTSVRPGRLDTALAGKAIEAYLATLRSSRSPYDRFRAGDGAALSESAQRGLELFRGRAGCVACHKEEGPKGWPLFRDGGFHNNGTAWLSRSSELGVGALRMTVTRSGPSETPGPLLDDGRGRFLAGDAYQRAFKTPSLRDVARHPPYMHDGSKATLEEVVAHYAAGCGDDPVRDPRLKGFAASDQDCQDLVAFLVSLTSEERPGRVTEAWKKRVKRTRVRFLDARGEPVVGFTVGLEQAGEQVPVESASPLPATAETDRTGAITYPVPGSTHVRLLLLPGMRLEGGALVPDTCGSAEIVLPMSGLMRLALVVEQPEISTPESLRAYEPREASRNDASSARLFVRVPWTLSRKGTITLDGQRAVLYEGYRMGAGHRSIVFRLPGQTAPQEVVLEPEAPAGSAVATQRVDVKREGSEEWRELVEQAEKAPTR